MIICVASGHHRVPKMHHVYFFALQLKGPKGKRFLSLDLLAGGSARSSLWGWLHAPESISPWCVSSNVRGFKNFYLVVRTHADSGIHWSQLPGPWGFPSLCGVRALSLDESQKCYRLCLCAL